MAQITPEQAMDIARTFSQYAGVVEDFRFAHIDNLSDIQESGLRRVEASLRSTSNDFLDLGINAELDNAQAAIEGLGQVTDLLKKDLTRLTTINTALQVAASLLQLGTGFATLNPATIVSGLHSTVTALQEISDVQKQSA